MILATACTEYQYEPFEPTGEVVTDVENVEVDMGEVAESISDSDEIDEVGDVLEDVEDEELDMDVEEDMEKSEEEVEEVEEVELSPETPIIEVFEGDLVDLGYTAPFDENGMWQTSLGDAGYYSVIVTATDNKESFVTKNMVVTVYVKNKPPVINIGESLEFDEGDLIKLNPDIYDEDEDEVVVIYSGWMTGRAYQTTYDDAGTYVVTIRADDGKEIISKDVTIVVNDFNRVPLFEVLSGAKVTGIEGDLIKVEVMAEDPDGDEIVFMFGEPLDENGEWQTSKGDAGVYETKVVATDGENEVVNEVLIELMKMNEPPVIKSITMTPKEIVLKKPGDKVDVSIEVVASDPDGDDLEITYSGFMESSKKTVTYGEKGGMKVVTVTVSDGKDVVTQDIKINMNNWPCFDCQ
jgi:hypothetical protein